MSFLQAVFSGILQGVTEFLPVSSTGHLVLLHNCFGFAEPQILFDILLHVGTLGAVVIFFSKDIRKIALEEKRLGLLALVSCVPTFAIGFFFGEFFETAFVDLRLTGLAFLVTGLWLFTGNKILRRNLDADGSAQHSINAKMNWRKAIIIGIAQGIALIPGVSRSGVTISTGLACGLHRDFAFRFSFLILIPTTLGALSYKIASTETILKTSPVSLIAGTLCAFLVGLACLKILYITIKKSQMHIFAIYCCLLGIITLTAGFVK